MNVTHVCPSATLSADICAKRLLLPDPGHLSSIQCRFAEQNYGMSFECLACELCMIFPLRLAAKLGILLHPRSITYLKQDSVSFVMQVRKPGSLAWKGNSPDEYSCGCHARSHSRSGVS